MRVSDCDSELLDEARRRTLTSTEMMRLRRHLAYCQCCRHAQQVFEDLDDEPAALADDRAEILAMSQLARRWVGQRNGRGVASRVGVGRSVRIGAMAASLTLIVGTVSAFWLWRKPQAADSASSGSMTAPNSRRALLPRPAPVAETPPPEAPALDPTVPAPIASDPTVPEPPRLSRPAGVRDTSPPVSAALLLKQADEARRRGDVAEAIIRYRRLQQVFPTSSSAVLSAPSLGGLLLETGAVRSALGQFDHYLRQAPTGVLVPEALYGRGRALRMLGEPAEERRAWRRLVSEFPDSPYAPLARRRLADLQ